MKFYKRKIRSTNEMNNSFDQRIEQMFRVMRFVHSSRIKIFTAYFITHRVKIFAQSMIYMFILYFAG